MQGLQQTIGIGQRSDVRGENEEQFIGRGQKIAHRSAHAGAGVDHDDIGPAFDLFKGPDNFHTGLPVGVGQGHGPAAARNKADTLRPFHDNLGQRQRTVDHLHDVVLGQKAGEQMDIGHAHIGIEHQAHLAKPLQLDGKIERDIGFANSRLCRR